MRIIDLVDPSCLSVGLRPGSRKILIRQLAEKAASRLSLKPTDILAALDTREQLGSTAFGGGVAIPHARLPFTGRAFAVMAFLESAINFDALDGAPVDVVCLLVTPQTPPTEHLRALASVSRLLRDRTVLTTLRGCKSSDAVYAVLDQWDQRQAA